MGVALVQAKGTRQSTLNRIILRSLTNVAGNIRPRGRAMLLDGIAGPWIGSNEANSLANRESPTTRELLGHAQPLKILDKSKTPGSFARWTMLN